MSESPQEEIANVKVDAKATTTFVDDSATSKETPQNEMQISSSYFLKSAHPESLMITKFLSKPVELETGQFSSTDTPTSFAGPRPMPFDLLNNNVYWPKIKGFYGLRATMVLTLQVNAQRFQQGRYMLVYVPCGGATSDAAANDWFSMHTATVVQRTQCYHVEIDVNKETSVELRIPFNSSHDVYPLQYGTNATSSKWGAYRIFPYQTLQSGSGSLTAKFTLWGHFEDIELVGQTLPVERQSNSMRESKSKGAGPVESVALKIKQAAGVLNNVPLLSSYTQPIGWVADLVGKTANIFGWSAPANLDKQYRVETSLFSYATNIDNIDKTNPLSNSVQNAVQVMPGEGLSDEDELSIPHLASRFTYQDRFTWADTNVEEALLATYLVGLYPMGGALTHLQVPFQFVDFTPAQWVGKRFDMYRGSVKMRFKIVKTNFHSGRISVDFNPEARNYISPPMLDASAPYLHRQIIDIRDINEFTLEFPFISHNPYLSTQGHGETHFGRIEIRVIDPLVAPATVTSSVTILMEHAMGPDIEFAGRYCRPVRIHETIEVQSNSMLIGDAIPMEEQHETSAVAIGEKIVNMRTMLKRYEPLRQEGEGAGTYGANFRPFNYGKLHSYLPFAVTRFTPSSIDNLVPDLYSELGSIFTYSRGGVRLKALPRDGAVWKEGVLTTYPMSQNTYAILGAGNFSTGQERTAYAESIPTVAARYPVPNLNYTPLGNTSTYNFTLVQNSRDRSVEIQIPQWLRQHSRNNVTHQCSSANPYTTNTKDETSKSFVYFYQNPQIGNNMLNTTGFILDIWRAAADDCNFTGFVSIPPMEVFYDTVLPILP